MSVENIQNRVYVIRGQQVMLDFDMGGEYGVCIKRKKPNSKNRLAM